jgi:predicted esterase
LPIELNLPTTIHGRILIEGPADSSSSRILVSFHGYKSNADDALADALQIPGVRAGWHVVAPQGLHRFYGREERIVASWMTRQDRELAIADNVAYIDAVLDEAIDGLPAGAAPLIVYAGFSQGAAMAYRAAVLGAHPAAGVIALGADMPPELRQADGRQPWPPVLVGVGTGETFYTPDKVAVDVEFLKAKGVPHELCRFEGGHEWTDAFRATAGRWLAAL